MKASEFDRLFDAGGDVTPFVDWASGRRPGQGGETVSIALSAQMLASLEREAARRGMSRDDLITLWLADHLDRAAE